MGSADAESKLRAVACRSAWPSLIVGEPLPAPFLILGLAALIKLLRAVVPQILAAAGVRIATDRYTDYDASRDFIGEPWLRPTAPTADIAVTANLIYDRFRSYAARKDRVSRPTGSYYRRLNALPHLDVSNGRPTLGYFNPVLRIVALDGNIERLQQISAAITAAAPEFKVRLIDRKPKT